MKVRDYLKQPFDYFNDDKSKRIYIISAIVFSHLFLIIFQPYGISEEMSNPENSTLNKFLFFFSIALTTFVALSLSQFVLRKWFHITNVSSKKYLGWLLFEALLLQIVNFGMAFIIPDLGNDFEEELNLWFQIKMYPKLLLILIFPFFGTVIFIAIKRLKSEVKTLDEQLHFFKHKYAQNSSEDCVELRDENNQIDISIPVNNLMYLESSNQYVLIYFIKNNVIKKHIVRNRLKNIIQQMQQYPIKQCHRSFAVNMMHIEHLLRKNGKAFLVFKADFEMQKIPVSNSFISTFDVVVSM
ncbi:hypothetical protein PK35_04965 [Tamlana nanhaiensis]|uniref:HTH LytTR-type domain-containing protein n=1 Tax=Neotamlana nanhaiensis TaxID=1382798 RepID=A0A0D7W5V7_9FLAO|nr:LytTR family DNA-binding domain-containing protein [Tamlana nanhaiensis]KJD34083.1 hypothetical protein PK35_04965 [Tamlana nanhaiensis]